MHNQNESYESYRAYKLGTSIKHAVQVAAITLVSLAFICATCYCAVHGFFGKGA